MAKPESTSNNNGAGAAFLVASLLTVPFAAWFGFVVKVTWGWFIVPLGVPAIGLWQAAGLCLVARLLTYVPRVDDRTPWEILGSSVLLGVLAPALTLAFAAIYHSFS